MLIPLTRDAHVSRRGWPAAGGGQRRVALHAGGRAAHLRCRAGACACYYYYYYYRYYDYDFYYYNYY